MESKTHLIQSIRKKKYSSNCYLCFDYTLEDEADIISLDLVLKYGLKKGLILSDNNYHRIIQEQRIIDIKQSAYSFASYKPRSEKQVRIRLSTKKYIEQEIDLAINFLYDFDLLDDKDYAERFSIDYLRRKNVSCNRLRQELLKRGVPKDLAQEVAERNYPHHQADEIIKKAVQKKLRAVSYKPIRKQKELVISYLQRQGFSWSQISPVIDELYLEKI